LTRLDTLNTSNAETGPGLLRVWTGPIVSRRSLATYRGYKGGVNEIARRGIDAKKTVVEELIVNNGP